MVQANLMLNDNLIEGDFMHENICTLSENEKSKLDKL